jgi:hypothetical protein
LGTDQGPRPGLLGKGSECNKSWEFSKSTSTNNGQDNNR